MPLSPTATRELLARLGHQPKRFLGQNFLVDGNIVRKSLELAALQPGDAVVEIGPGAGALTPRLAQRARGYLMLFGRDRRHDPTDTVQDVNSRVVVLGGEEPV